MSSSPVAPTESHRPNSREVLIEAAVAEFSAKGYEGTTVASIAERAGVTTGALYAHFTGKLHLLVAAIGLQQASEFLRAGTWATTRPWSEVPAVIGRDLSRRPDGRTRLLLDVIVLARRQPEVAAGLNANLQHYLDAIRRAVEAGVASGDLDPAVEPDDLAHLLAAVALGNLVLAVLGERGATRAGFGQLASLLLRPGGGDGADDGEDGTLALVRQRAVAAEQARGDLARAIGRAVEAGHSLRQVGEAAGISHEQVRRLLSPRRTPRRQE